MTPTNLNLKVQGKIFFCIMVNRPYDNVAVFVNQMTYFMYHITTGVF